MTPSIPGLKNPKLPSCRSLGSFGRRCSQLNVGVTLPLGNGIVGRRESTSREGVFVASDHGRQFIYEYNGNELKQEIEYDPTGQREVLNIGSVIVRHEKEWKETRVFAPVTPRGIRLVRCS